MDSFEKLQLGSAKLDKKINRFVEDHGLQRDGRTWGFIIVRPSTLKANAEQWNTALSTIRNDMSRHFNASRIYSRPPLEPLPDDAILPMRRLEITVVDLDMPQGHSGVADDAMVDAARERFRSWRIDQLEMIRQQDREERRSAGMLDEDAEEDDPNTYRLNSREDTILLVDSQAIDGLLNPGDVDPHFEPYVLAIDVWYQPNPNELYLGWMRVLTGGLMNLFSDIECSDMETFCPTQNFEGQIPLYDGSIGGTLVNPPGAVFSGPLIGTMRGPARGGG